MDNNEATRIIAQILDDFIFSTVDEGDRIDNIEACKKAIEALNKQLPKRPNCRCPSCNYSVFDNMYGKYCANCGQALDWSSRQVR